MKKIAALLLCLFMVLGTVCVVSAETDASMSGLPASIQKDEIAIVTVSLSGTPTMSSAMAHIQLGEGLSLVSAEWLKDGALKNFDMNTNRGVLAPGGTGTLDGDVIKFTVKGTAAGEDQNIQVDFTFKNGTDPVGTATVSKTVDVVGMTAAMSGVPASLKKDETAVVTVNLSGTPTMSSAMAHIQLGEGLSLVSAEWLKDGALKNFDMNTNRGVLAPGGTGTLDGDVIKFTVKGTAAGEDQNIQVDFTFKNGTDPVGTATVSKTVDVVAGSAVVDEWGLTLKDEVVVKFNMNFTPETLADADAYVEVKLGDKVTQVAVADVVGPLEIPVSAAQMTEEITLCVVDGEENRGEENVFTIRQYCESILASEEHADYHQLVKEMLNYGGAAQAYFGYNMDDMANEGLEGVGTLDVPEEAAVEKTISGEVEGISYYGASLLLQDKVALRFYFEVSGDISDYTFKVGGKEVSCGQKYGMYYVDAKDILAWDLDAPVTVTVNDTLTVTHSPLTYIVNMSDDSAPQLRDMLKALYNYHLVAKEFVAQD